MPPRHPPLIHRQPNACRKSLAKLGKGSDPERPTLVRLPGQYYEFMDTVLLVDLDSPPGTTMAIWKERGKGEQGAEWKDKLDKAIGKVRRVPMQKVHGGCVPAPSI